MSPEVQRNVEKIIDGSITYTSSNLGLNNLFSRFREQVSNDPSRMEECVREFDTYVTKYQFMMSGELNKIASL